MKKLIIFLTLIYPIVITATPVITISDNFTENNFTNKKVILLQKGDNPDYKNPDYNDSSWHIISLPAKWQDKYPQWNGICWYRIHVKFPVKLPDKSLGISLGTIIDADEIFFNGKLIGKSGKFPPNQESVYDKKRIYEIPTGLIIPGKKNIIAIRIIGVFPYANGPYLGEFKITSFHNLLEKRSNKDLFDIFFIVIYLVFGVYFLAFFLRRRKDKENLFFSFFAFTISFYFLFQTQLKFIFHFNFYYSKKIEYLILSFIALLFVEFISYYFKKKHNIFNYIIVFQTVISLLLITFTSNFVFWDQVNQYIIQPVWILIAFPFIFYLLIINLRKNKDALYMLIALIIFIATVIHDILLLRAMIDSIRIAGYGLLSFIGSIALTLNNKFVRLHNEIEHLNENLENSVVARTRELEVAMEELQSINDYVTEINLANQRELQLATKVQNSLVTPLIKNKFWDIEIFYKASFSVSGDFFDFYRLPDGEIIILLADVSGHGVASALITMIAKPIFFRTISQSENLDFKNFFEKANLELIDSIEAVDHYLTGIAIKLNEDSLNVLNAAHPPPFLKKNSNGEIINFDSSGTFLGIKEMVSKYELATNKIESGDIIILYTDAITESKNKNNEEFGIERIKEILKKKNYSPKEIIDELISSLFEFTEDTVLQDDLTIIAAKRKA